MDTGARGGNILFPRREIILLPGSVEGRRYEAAVYLAMLSNKPLIRLPIQELIGPYVAWTMKLVREWLEKHTGQLIYVDFPLESLSKSVYWEFVYALLEFMRTDETTSLVFGGERKRWIEILRGRVTMVL